MCPALEAAAPSLLRPWFSSYIDDWMLQASEPSTVGYIASPCQVMAHHMQDCWHTCCLLKRVLQMFC